MLPSCCMAKNALKLKKKFNKKLYYIICASSLWHKSWLKCHKFLNKVVLMWSWVWSLQYHGIANLYFYYSDFRPPYSLLLLLRWSKFEIKQIVSNELISLVNRFLTWFVLSKWGCSKQCANSKILVIHMTHTDIDITVVLKVT